MGRLWRTNRRQKTGRHPIRNLSGPLLAAVVTAAILWLAFWLGGFAPFGNNTPAVTDAKLQYLDLFAYYRDVLTGQNSAAYTFSNTLGGSAIAIWAYYLASPFNLLVLLFPKEQMNLFLEVLITVKCSAASASFAFFLGQRFRGRIRRETALVLSVSYGLMQYMLAQGSNVMWLDGVILLPFIVLGVHKAVQAERNSVLFLAVSAAVSVLANWYTGGINYLFSFVWFVYEVARRRASRRPSSGGSGAAVRGGSKNSAKTRGKAGGFSGSLCRYLAGMGLGLMLASFLFVPNVLALRLGKGAGWSLTAGWSAAAPARAGTSALVASDSFAQLGLRGNPLSVLRSYRIGEISDSSRVSFFCGSFALLGTVAFFCSGRIRKRDKAAGAGLLLFTVMTVFWQPLFVLFSLFQYSNSYWYRYGYLGSFVLLYLAAYWAGSLNVKASASHRQAGVILKAGAISVLMVIISQRIRPSGGMRSTRIMALVLIGITAHLFVQRRTVDPASGNGSARREPFEEPDGNTKNCRPAGKPVESAAVIAFAVLCIGEMFLQTRAMLGIYHTDTAQEYAAYSIKEQEQTTGLLSFDKDGFYRVNQTSTRIGNKDGLTAAYLDAMAYGYASVSGYTSCPENIQLDFLDRLGYRKEYDSFNIVNTSFLPADSLLGVRYVLSGYEIPGLREVKELGVHNGKAVYENPFALPAAMILDGGGAQGELFGESGTQREAPENGVQTETSGKTAAQSETVKENPFAYVERIYGELSGQQAGLFVPVAANRENSAGKTTWTLTVPEGNYCLYGNLPWKEDFEGRLMVSEERGYGYGGWLSPSVFYIPMPEKAESDEPAQSAGMEGNVEPAQSAGSAGNSDPVQTKATAKETGAERVVRVTLETRGEPQLVDEQFYALDLDRLAEGSARIRERSAAVRELEVSNGKISCTVDASEGQKLILSVPASKGWTARLNGQKTEFSAYEDCFIIISLLQGENHITMQYRVPGKAAGAVMTLLGVGLLTVYCLAGGILRKGRKRE